MGLSIGEHVVNTNHRVAGLGALLGALVEGLFDRWDVLIGNVLTLGLVHELAREICLLSRLILWLDIANNLSVLSSTSRLLLVEEVEGCFVCDSFSVVDSGVSNDKINIVLTLHTLAVDEQVKLSHS